MNPEQGTLRAIIFDWAGVFCSPGEPYAHPKLYKQTGLTLAQIEERTEPLRTRYYRGTIPTDEFWRGVVAELGLEGITGQELGDAYLSSYVLYPEMLPFADSMRPRFKTALLSNLTADMTDHIVRTHDVKKYFDCALFSNETGRLKPETASFTEALAALGVSPAETLFVDDSPGNIAAAHLLGMRTLLVTSPEQCRSELVRRTRTGADDGTL